jgi:aryl-alcohol dehydrogenase-like predicted oxidoreductase
LGDLAASIAHVAATPPSTATAAGELTLGGDMPVHRLGYGAMRVTGQGIWGEPEDRDGAIALLRRLGDLEVNFIDTADSYGPAASEELIAAALHPYPPDLVIATKGGLTRPGPGRWEVDCRPARLKRCCDESLLRLKLDAIPLYQLHTPDSKVPFEESVGALAELRDEGKVRHVGLSNVGVEHLRQAQQIVPIVSVQNRYSVTARDAEELLEACREQGLAFIPWFPLDAGRIGADVLAEIASGHDATPVQVALAWLLQHSGATIPIPGTSSIEHLEENVAAAALRLTDDELERLDALATG